MLSAPNKVFKNSDGKNVYCWHHGNEITISLSRLDKEESGKCKTVPVKEVNSFLKKLGVDEGFKLVRKPTLSEAVKEPVEIKKELEESFIDKPIVRTKVVGQNTDSLGFYRKDIDVSKTRESYNKLMESKTVTGISKKDNNVKKPGFMDELALISGAINKPVVHEKQIVSEQIEQDKPLFKDVKITKKSMTASGTEFIKKDKSTSKEILHEGKNDRIILGKITTGEEEVDGLGWIKIENIPTIVEDGDINSYKYKLQGIIEAQLNKDMPRLKQIPEVANYENKTYAEASGAESGAEEGTGGEDITGLGELTAGIQPEGSQQSAPQPTEGGQISGLEGSTEAIQSGTEAY